MKTLTRTLAAATAAAGLALGTAATAGAVTVTSYDNVRMVFCSDNPNGNAIDWYDVTGSKREAVGITLREHVGGTRYCDSVAYTEPGSTKYGRYLWSAVQNEDSPYVYCAIWVDGRKAAESEDYSSYGYAFTSC
jgi:hypothetical protein